MKATISMKETFMPVCENAPAGRHFHGIRKKKILFIAAFVLCFFPAGCSALREPDKESAEAQDQKPDTAFYLTAVEDEPDTVDFQCTSIHYMVAQNVFDRLVEMDYDENGEVKILPSLASSWEESDDCRTYTFHLRDNIAFSNGKPLTSSDVLYTFERLLTHPDSCNQDIADMIEGAEELEKGETDQLEGFTVLNDHDFTITLEQPFEAFLACLSMPGASILDEETTEEAKERFGTDPEWTIGTGSYILNEWIPGEHLLLTANQDCWKGAPKNKGLDLQFLTEPEEEIDLFENGGMDILDLDEVGDYSEYFIHGDIYQDRLFQCRRIGTWYIALNESVRPLDDVRIRKAMQLALDRPMLLNAVYSGRGSVENGIYPHGLYGYNPDLPEIPCDPEKAEKLLDEAGFPDGFDLTVQVKSSSTQSEMTLIRLAASMWEKAGIHATIKVLEEDEFMRLRKSGELTCYAALWTADYNDPDNFIYTFFGNRENTTFRSLCYPDEAVMKRVREARAIQDSEKRVREYQELERIIVQEDAAWIPLFSRTRTYVTSKRVDNVQASWNGSVKNMYREAAIQETS